MTPLCTICGQPRPLRPHDIGPVCEECRELVDRGVGEMAKGTNMICPVCNGKKFSASLACGRGQNGESFSRLSQTACHECGGAGDITAERAEELAVGEAMRQDRIRRGLSTREEAARLGISPQELNNLEHAKRRAV